MSQIHNTAFVIGRYTNTWRRHPEPSHYWGSSQGFSARYRWNFHYHFRFKLWSCGNVVNYFPCFKAVLKSIDRARAWVSGTVCLKNLCFELTYPELVFYCSADPNQYPDSAITKKLDLTILILFVLDRCRYLSFLFKKRSKICFKKEIGSKNLWVCSDFVSLKIRIGVIIF